jgi:cyclophilin family peptidyl-prolyl cis-trans isomerase
MAARRWSGRPGRRGLSAKRAIAMMLRGIILGVVGVLVLAAAASGQAEPPRVPAPPKAVEPPAAPAKLVFVRMSTTAGDIILELNGEKAPISVANFLSYVDKHAYDGNIFHRVIPTFMVQGGGYTPDLTELKGDAPIKNEWQNGLKNVRGTIAMAREAEPDTATREFYINVVDNPKLDGPRPTTGNAGYAVFGRVVAGMEAVDKIRDGKTGPRTDKEMENVPLEPFKITGVVRISAEDAAKAIAGSPAAPSGK